MDQYDPLARTSTDDGTPRFPAACIDCPAARVGCFEAAVGDGTTPCRFVKARVQPRAPIPTAWAESYALVLVRRGVIVRTRAPKHGPSVPIDCAGAGSVLSLTEHTVEIGYAATEVLVCLHPRNGLDEALARDKDMARDVILGLSATLERVERLAEARGQATVDERVARVLVVVAETLAPPHRRELLPSGLQQRDLARLAGVRHESFCRSLGKLERAGLVKREPEGLRIERHDDLVALAG